MAEETANEKYGAQALQSAKTRVVIPARERAEALIAGLRELSASLMEVRRALEQKIAEERAAEEAAALAAREAEERAAEAEEKAGEAVPVPEEPPAPEVPEETPAPEEPAPAPAPAGESPAPEQKKVLTRVFDGTSPRGERRERPPRPDRPAGAPRPPRPGAGPKLPPKPATPPPAFPKGRAPEQKKPAKKTEEKKGKNVRTLLNQGYIQRENYSIYNTEAADARYNRRRKKGNPNAFNITERTVIDHAVMTSPLISVKQLAEKIGKTGSEIIKVLFKVGIMKTINDAIDFDTAELVSSEFGVTLEYDPAKTAEDRLRDMQAEDETAGEAGDVPRPPVITVMGHVDHGKTSLLDYIRKARVTDGEAGGITQHIGAYTVTLGDKKITFLDTPGHEAFTSMRMRGAQVTDIAVIVVAADDGVMPQTVEAISHARTAGVQIIVAVNKIDKPQADPDRIMKQLTEYEIVPEEWGGTVPVVRVSAKTGQGVDELLETIAVTAEVMELKADPGKLARGTVIEAKLDKGKGPLATVLVQNGTLKVGDYVVAGTASGKIRGMIDDAGRNVKKAGPSTPVAVLGFSEVPNAGDTIAALEDEKLARQVAAERADKIKDGMVTAHASTSLDDFFARMQQGETKTLNVILKADVQGSVEAVKQSLMKLSGDEVRISVVHSAVGAVNESDVMLASTSGAIIIGFNVRPDREAREQAERDGIDIRLYTVIYDAIDDVEAAVKGMLAPKFREVPLGTAEVRKVFKITGAGTIGGCFVTDGKATRSGKVRLFRDNALVYEGEVGSLKRFKDDVREVARGYECGIGITNYNDLKEGDVMEFYAVEEIDG